MFLIRVFVLYLLLCCVLGSSLWAAPINQFQVIGSHNSYKKALFPVVQDWLTQTHPPVAAQISYSHLSLSAQLDSGLRQLEIDVVADPEGGHYAKPWAESFFKQSLLTDAQRQTLSQSGFKVLHIPGLDINSHCLSFISCLSELRTWSDTHPSHFPLMILLNAKESQADFVQQNPPLAFDASLYEALDKAIVAGLGREKLFIPDDLRGGALRLRDAVMAKRWPDVSQLRGKFIFLFDANPAQANLYRQHHTSLRSRSMFCTYPANEDEAAIIVANEPIRQQDQIRRWVSKGFLVRTRADANFSATTEQKLAQFRAAKRSGAQWISSDFYVGSPQGMPPLSSPYQVRFTHPQQHDGMNEWVRFNPVFTFTP